MYRYIFVIGAKPSRKAGRDEWEEAIATIPGAGLEYIQTWQSYFNLFDLNKPFLQIAALVRVSKVSKSREKLKCQYFVMPKKERPLKKLSVIRPI